MRLTGRRYNIGADQPGLVGLVLVEAAA
jgi:hypothetical protein